MQRTVLWIVGLLVATGTSGCFDSLTGGSPTGTLQVSVDDTTTGVTMAISGIFAREAGTEDGWIQVVGPEDGASWVLGSSVDVDGDAPAQAYDLLQVTFASVTQDGQSAILTENGFVLPIAFSVSDGGTTSFEVGFAWTDALFDSQQGLAFAPALRKLVVTEDGVETVNQEAAEIDVGGTKPPVARMRVLDETWQIWESDFLAESDDRRKKGTAGNVTFLASASEALAPGATLAKYTWAFSDGTTLEGATVNKIFDLGGGNHSVTLTVTDSNGVSDSQHLNLALQPGAEILEIPFQLADLTGFTPSGACTTGQQTFEVEVDPTMTPSGSAAGVASVVTTFAAQAPHPQTKLDMEVEDGAGGALGSDSGGLISTTQTDGSATKNFDPAGAQPAAGTWKVHIQPCKAYDLSVTGRMTVTWAGVGDAGFVAWYAGYDDGENR